MFDMSPEGIKRLIEKGESQQVEFKMRLPPENIVAQNMVAFANTEGGIILIGVGQNGEIVGLTKLEEKIAKEKLITVGESVLPLTVQVGSISNIDDTGKTIVYAVIEKVPKELGPVTTSQGRVYERKQSINLLIDSTRIGVAVRTTGLRRDKVAKEVKTFVAMSFRSEEEPALVDYFQAIMRAAKSTGKPITVSRMDLEEGDYEISQKIMDEIEQAEIVIADLTLNSRNVYFELGYARGKNKRIIQTARKDANLEFDIRNWRAILYRNATELEEKLIPALLEAYTKITESTK